MASFTPQEIEEFLREFFDTVGARQYVGARYVPIFGRKGEDTVEWDDGAPYEPLTVVMHQGVSYVSRQYVPAGTPITSTDFWVETYRFNAQVEQYRQEVLGFQDQIDDRVPFPDPEFYPRLGTLGQVLTTLADGTTKWEDPVIPSDEQAEEIITQWLDDHPEATTTVQDGAITTPKIANGAVTDAKMAAGGVSETAIRDTYTNVTDSNYATVLPDLDAVMTNSVQRLFFSNGATSIPANTPFGSTWKGSAPCLLLTLSRIPGQLHVGNIQLFLSLENGTYLRQRAGSSWGPWGMVTPAAQSVTGSMIADGTVGDAKLAPGSIVDTALRDTYENVTDDNYSTVLPDLDAVTANTVYRLFFTDGTTTIPANTPFGSAWKGSEACLLLTLARVPGQLNLGNVQLFVSVANGTYLRQRAGSSWGPWSMVTPAAQSITNEMVANGTIKDEKLAAGGVVNSSLKRYYQNVTVNNYATDLPDFDAVTTNSIYRLFFDDGTATIPAHSPFGATWKGDNGIAFLFNMLRNENLQNLGNGQIFVNSEGVYIRQRSSSAWGDWVKVAEMNDTPRRVVVDPYGNGDYTSLTEALNTEQWNDNVYVYVRRGTYDAIAEAKALFGDDYFDNWGTSYGPTSLRNGIHVYCEPGTVYQAHYTGDDANVMGYYSPINLKYDCTVENMTIDASRVRYCIHDDLFNDATPYHHVMRNLTLKIDNTQNTGWDRRQALGGGFGVNGNVEIENCVFQSAGLDGTTERDPWCSASYHNSPNSEAQSMMSMLGCYFVGDSTFILTWHGTSTKVTTALVSGCSTGKPMRVEATTETSLVQNVQLIDCNNVVRA